MKSPNPKRMKGNPHGSLSFNIEDFPSPPRSGKVFGFGRASSVSLHAASLNQPGVTLKDLHVTKQHRYEIVNRISCITTKSETVVTYSIKAESSEETAKLSLKNMWSELRWLTPGTLVNIVEVDADENNCFHIERLQGYLIVDPDQLISATTVISQMFCDRKVGLSRLSPGGDSPIAFRGVLAHELICRAMVKSLKTEEELRRAARQTCSLNDMLERAYGLKMTDTELEKFQEETVGWVFRFMCNRFNTGANNPKQNFKFMEVLGVEDNVWNPTFGLKGKIDSTVMIERSGQKMIVPLEFKTGSTKSLKRQAVRADHVGQVSMYTLMMCLRYGTVEEAMLYYISDDTLSLSPVRKIELQQLLVNRNKLIFNSKLTNGDFPNLPRPEGIEFDFKCKGCEVRSACALNLKKTVPFEAMTETEKKICASSEFSEAEIELFENWLKVINSETEEVEKKYNAKYIWTKLPEERAAAGTCVSDLKLISDSVLVKDSYGKPSYLITLEKTGNSQEMNVEPFWCLQIDDFVVFSSNVEACINYGKIGMIRGKQITVMLDQKLHEDYKRANYVFCLDKINSSSPIASQYGYLLKLMEDSAEATRLRQYLTMQKVPRFPPVIKPDDHVQKVAKDLNFEQVTVIAKAMSTDSFLFVKGTPGSGKTTTIVALIRALVSQKRTVLVVSYTGTALENILLKYKNYNNDFVKISTSGRANDLLNDRTTKEISKGICRIDELTKVYNQPVIGTTLLSLKHPIFKVRRFDYCIVDEASQALPTAVLGALLLSDKYVIFGDPNQLPPVMQSSVLKDLDMPDNFFSMMSTDDCTLSMNIQFRMNRGINDLANKLMYRGVMKCADSEQARSHIQASEQVLRSYLMEKISNSSTRRALCHAVSKRKEKAVVMMDTCDLNSYESRIDESIANVVEKDVTITLVRLLLECNIRSVGVIAPYRAQVNLIERSLKKLPNPMFHKVEVNTVDQYQGREMDVIICCFTKSLPKSQETTAKSDKRSDEGVEKKHVPKQGILEDARRLNVAITRAKRKLILIGNSDTLQKYGPLKELFNVLQEEQICKLTLDVVKEFQAFSSLGAEETPCNSEVGSSIG